MAPFGNWADQGLRASLLSLGLLLSPEAWLVLSDPCSSPSGLGRGVQRGWPDSAYICPSELEHVGEPAWWHSG